MKQNVIIIECVVKEEFESVLVRNPSGAILFAGNIEDATEFVKNELLKLKD